MKYPIFEVPWLGGGWIIGLVATLHVFISQFAVGGGLFLPLMERSAHLRGDRAMAEWLRRHAKFFLILTSSVGASLGVGIWFAISVVHPPGAATLLRTFVQLWALEWVFFFVEVLTLAIYYYSWGRISAKTHIKIGWIYFASSFGSLFVINGILSCMLMSGTMADSGNPWDGFFNPIFWPSLILRTCVCFGLAGGYAFFTAASIEDGDLKSRVMRFSAWWVLPAFVLVAPVGFWAYEVIPDVSKALMQGGMAGAASGTNSILTRVAMVLLVTSATLSATTLLGPVMNPKHHEKWVAASVLVVAFVATLSTEWVREVIRKPFVISGIMYSSGIRADEVETQSKSGHLAASPWATAWRDLETPTLVRTGEAMFRSQCMACHTRDGYRSMKGLLGKRNNDAILGFLDMIQSTDKEKNSYLRFMPPLVATDDEKRALAIYLSTLSQTSRERH